MFLLPPRLRHFLEKKREKEERLFSLEPDSSQASVRAAQAQGRPEEEVLFRLGQRRAEPNLQGRSCRGQVGTALRSASMRFWHGLPGQAQLRDRRILGICQETVKTHLQHIFRKFGPAQQEGATLASCGIGTLPVGGITTRL